VDNGKVTEAYGRAGDRPESGRHCHQRLESMVYLKEFRFGAKASAKLDVSNVQGHEASADS
jgi:hypothetical protein